MCRAVARVRQPLEDDDQPGRRGQLGRECASRIQQPQTSRLPMQSLRGLAGVRTQPLEHVGGLPVHERQRVAAALLGQAVADLTAAADADASHHLVEELVHATRRQAGAAHVQQEVRLGCALQDHSLSLRTRAAFAYQSPRITVGPETSDTIPQFPTTYHEMC